MKSLIKYILPLSAVALTLGVTSCVGDLDVTPIDPNVVTKVEPSGLFNKCYANLGIGGRQNGDGDSDIEGIDGGMSAFLRQLFNSNELTTDEAICWWSDEGLAEYSYNTYNSTHPMLKAYYYRLYYGISVCNLYLQQFGSEDATKTAEVRFLRALYYYYLLDAFGNVPWITEPTSTGPQLERKEIYQKVVDETLAAEKDLAAPKAKTSDDEDYGRADKAAAWMLLARLYLNAEVYTGTPQWDLASQYAKKVMTESGRELLMEGQHGWTPYQMLFMGDNGESNAAKEAILPIIQDGKKVQSYGGTFYFMAGCYGSDIHPYFDNYTSGVNANWSGLRTTPQFLSLFFGDNIPEDKTMKEMQAEAKDERALFWGKGQTLDVTANTAFKYGLAVVKYNNFYSSSADGTGCQNPDFPDTDFFLMRLAEANLTYAEAEARLNGGNATGAAAKAINDLRKRAGNPDQPNVYSLQDILDEWGREFYYEGRRRTDLIRFGQYTTGYTWQWKGGVHDGRSISDNLKIFAIPADDIFNGNGLIKQNPGY